MFGYVIPNKAELKFREFDVYRSYYCGLCSALRKMGIFTAFSLSYDLTFLYMLLSSLYEPKCEKRCVRCICHPFKKHCESNDEYASYAAQMTVILSYYKCLDDFHDDKNIIALLYSFLLRRPFKHASRKYPEKAKNIALYLSEISTCEKTGSLEGAANAFGHILSEAFAPHDDMWKEHLSKAGFYLGKFIYIMDAYDDVEKDIKRHRPNPIIKDYNAPDFERKYENLLNMMAAEAAAAFDYLPTVENNEILRNIIYGGIWLQYEKTASERKLNINGSET